MIVILGRVAHAGAAACVSVALMGPALGVIGWSSSLTIAVIGCLIVGLASGICVPLLNALATTAADPEHVGRVLSLLAAASYGGVPVSYVLTGVIAAQLGTSAPFAISAACALGIGLGSLLIPSLRSAELPRQHP
jgi:MFS family permease